MPIELGSGPGLGGGFGQAAYQAGQVAQADKNRQYQEDYLRLMGQVAGQVAQQKLGYAELYQRADQARQSLQAQLYTSAMDRAQQQARDVFQANQQWRQQQAGFSQQAARDQFQAHQSLIQLGAQLQQRTAEHVFDSQMGAAQEQARLAQQSQRDIFQARQQDYLQQQQFGQQQARDVWQEQQHSQGQQELFQHQQDMQSNLFGQQQQLEQMRQAGRDDRLQQRLSQREVFDLNKLDNALGWATGRLNDGTLSQQEYDQYRAGILSRRGPLQQRQQFWQQQDQQQALQQAQQRIQVVPYPPGHPEAGQPIRGPDGQPQLMQMDRNGLWQPMQASGRGANPEHQGAQELLHLIDRVDQRMLREMTPPANAPPGWQPPVWAADPQSRDAERQRQIQADFQLLQQMQQQRRPAQPWQASPANWAESTAGATGSGQPQQPVNPADAIGAAAAQAQGEGRVDLAQALSQLSNDLASAGGWQGLMRRDPERFRRGRYLMAMLGRQQQPQGPTVGPPTPSPGAAPAQAGGGFWNSLPGMILRGPRIQR